MKFRQLITGIATFIPGVYNHFAGGTSGTDSARYSYSVWMRHLVMAKINGIEPYPKVIAELGPGDSLGIGLAALISGCEKYYALDVVEFSNIQRNAKIFEELLVLFNNRTPIPGDNEFPKVKPTLDSYDFPSDIFDDNRLKKALENDRIEKIRKSINNPDSSDSIIKYVVPWSEAKVIEKGSLDMVYSQSVLQYIVDLNQISKFMSFWLKPTGFISHQIDFKCQKTADEWNGHWTYSDFIWSLIKGKRPYFITREPHSTYINYLNNDFKIVCDKKVVKASHYTIKDLSPRFKFLTDEDLITTDSFIQGVKK